jgi:hypothetical protein
MKEFATRTPNSQQLPMAVIDDGSNAAHMPWRAHGRRRGGPPALERNCTSSRNGDAKNGRHSAYKRPLDGILVRLQRLAENDEEQRQHSDGVLGERVEGEQRGGGRTTTAIQLIDELTLI